MSATAESLHREQPVQDRIVAQLVERQGYVERAPADHDKTLALDKELVIRFLRETQSDEWEKLAQHYAGSEETELFRQLQKALKQVGTLQVLRQGIKIVPGIKFALCHFQPASNLNPELVRAYEANILSVIKEVEYSTKSGNRLDIVLYLNGLPIATMEVKNTLAGTTYKNAEAQYQKDRSPGGEPLLTFRRGALVHFALDQDFVSMTTRLKNGKTVFLPFNRGREGGAGNPDVEDDHRIAYLYADQPDGKAIFSREVLLDVVGGFLHYDSEKDLILFPRFQQLDAVRKAMRHARSSGAGQNYLIQHSAGSGKSNTIGWMAHHAIKLHDENDAPIFHAAIIVTDRVVLDRQLQRTVSDLEQTAGVVRKIDGTSRQLRQAIESGARIIITTIQKFGTDHLKDLAGQSHRRFALLIDEAHGSQSGKHADAMASALARDETSPEDLEDRIIAFQKARGPQGNISYFAFTATPRNVTLERFGVTGSDGKPYPFHLYSMRQAIEEGFILDVLQNYMTYKAYYQLEKTVEDDPEYTKSAQRKVAKYAHLHATAVGQKAGIIVEHFRRHVARELGGQAKAMVVTQSREHALRTYQAIKRYITENGYRLGTLVAFSGSLELDDSEQAYTEAELNGFAETELPKRFDGSDYSILVVAEKYQTGFDQPKLCAMYVDRKLAGLQAVQTLSRLNRTKSGKDRTFVLDFQNTTEEIQEAFRPFFEVTSLEAPSDANQIYELERRIRAYGFLDKVEVERFAETYYQERIDQNARVRLEGLVRNAADRFAAEEDERRREEFRQLIKSYRRFYTFLAQIMPLEDSGLEKLATYAEWLERALPDRENPPDPTITEDMLELRAFRIEEKERGDASLAAGDTKELTPISDFAAKPFTPEEARALSEIIDSFNQRHGTDFSESDFLRFASVTEEVLSEGDMQETLRNNPPDVSRGVFNDAAHKASIRAFARDAEMRNVILTDAELRGKIFSWMFSTAMREVAEAR